MWLPITRPTRSWILSRHRRIAVIQGVHYVHENHTGLFVDWAADSSWCAATYEARYGFETITLVELKSGTQSDLGKHIQKELDAGIVKSGGSGGLLWHGALSHRSRPVGARAWNGFDQSPNPSKTSGLIIPCSSAPSISPPIAGPARKAGRSAISKRSIPPSIMA